VEVEAHMEQAVHVEQEALEEDDSGEDDGEDDGEEVESAGQGEASRRSTTG
jgi:hypothetical protein